MTNRVPPFALHPSLRALLKSGLWALLMPCVVSAQGLPDDRGDPETRQLDTVNVTARRSIEDRFFAAGSMVVVDRQDIEQLGAFSVADVLKQLPGVQVITNANGGVEIRMRGMERSATQLQVDGQRVANGGSQLALDQLPSEMLERIEVMRAPTAEFAGATAGTLNLVLRQATVQRETTIRLTDNRVWGREAGQAFFSKSGSLGGSKSAATAGQTTKPAPAAPDVEEGAPVEASAASTPSSAASPTPALPTLPEIDRPWTYFVALSDNGLLQGSDTHRTTLTDGVVTTASDSAGRYRSSNLAFLPRVNGRLSGADQLGLRGTVSRFHFAGDYASQGNGVDTVGPPLPYQTTVAENYLNKRHYAQAAADWTHRFANSKLESTLSASEAHAIVDRTGDSERDYAAGPAIGVPYSFYDDRQDHLQTFSSKLTGTASPLLWSTGVLAEHRSVSVDNQTANGAAPPQQLAIGVATQRNALWGQNEWELPANTTLIAGLRYESLTISSNDATLLSQRSTHFWQPSLHVRTPLSEDLQWRANLARVTRNPNIWDLVDRRVPSQGSNSINNPDAVGNPDLRPEVAWTLDTGFERRLARQGQMGLNLFVRQLKDVIATTVTQVGTRWVEQRENVGDATVWGLEFDAKTGLTWLGLARDWTLSANASLLQSRMTSGINEGNRIPGQARYLANISVAKPLRRSGGFFGGGTLSMTGPAQLNSSPGITGHADARTALDVYIGSVFPKLGYWRIGLFNMGNARFLRERNYVDASGRAVRNDSSMTLTPRLYLTVGTQF